MSSFDYTSANGGIDGMGRRRGAYETVAGGTYNIACEYDKLSRLTSYSISGDYALSRSFTYDNTGNRTDSGFAYDEFDVGVNTDILATDGTFTYGFDNNGNLVSKTGAPGAWTYTYDPDNLLRTVEIAAGGQTKTITYWYDPMGNLVERSCTIGSQTTTTDYTVDIAQGLPVVLIEQRSGGETLLYTYGEDLLKVSKDGDYYYFYDGLGSTRTITSGAAGTVVAEYLYDAYGAQLLTGQPTWNTLLFTGEPRDPDTGLIYLRARWYDPGIGRFVSRDTYEGSPVEPLSQNRYLYCLDNPVNLTDPSGHFSMPEFSVSTFISSTLTGMRAVGTFYAKRVVTNTIYGAVIGTAAGGWDAILGGESGVPWTGFANGAVGGAIFGGLGSFNGINQVLQIIGIALGGGGTIQSIREGKYAQAGFRGALTALGAFAYKYAQVLRASPSQRHSMSNIEARIWYLSQLKEIPSLVDQNACWQVRGTQAYLLRFMALVRAREMMADRATAAELWKNNPPKTLSQMIARAQKSGLKGDNVWKYIYESSQKSNPDVNAELGIGD